MAVVYPPLGLPLLSKLLPSRYAWSTVVWLTGAPLSTTLIFSGSAAEEGTSPLVAGYYYLVADELFWAAVLLWLAYSCCCYCYFCSVLWAAEFAFFMLVGADGNMITVASGEAVLEDYSSSRPP